MSLVLIGNIISFIACCLMVVIGVIKKKEHILVTQCVQFSLFAISNMVLGGWTGAVSNSLSIVRNIRCIKKEISIWEKLFYIAIQIAISAFVNKSGLVGWAPVVAACLFTLVLTTQNTILLKLIIILGQLLWTFYDFSIRNYVGVTFDIITVFTNIVGIVMLLTGKNRKESE